MFYPRNGMIPIDKRLCLREPDITGWFNIGMEILYITDGCLGDTYKVVPPSDVNVGL